MRYQKAIKVDILLYKQIKMSTEMHQHTTYEHKQK